LHGLLAPGGDPAYCVTEFLHDRFYVPGREQHIFDDEHLRG
jgi:hypothetical protein